MKKAKMKMEKKSSTNGYKPQGFFFFIYFQQIRQTKQNSWRVSVRFSHYDYR